MMDVPVYVGSGQSTVPDEFYVRYYVGHTGRYGHEFLEFDLDSRGRLRYANNSNYKKESLIRKESTCSIRFDVAYFVLLTSITVVHISPLLLGEALRIIRESGVLKLNDSTWPEPNVDGKQELEFVCGSDHICFATSKIGSILDTRNTSDPHGLRSFFYMVQDLKCFVLSLISLHFKVKPTSLL